MAWQKSKDHSPGWWREYYSAVFPLWRAWSQSMEEKAEEVVGFMGQNLKLRPGNPFLDLGCGEGRHSRCLVKRGLRGYALDLFGDRLRKGVEKSSAQNLKGPTFIQADMRALPFKPQSFGLILLMDTTLGIFDDGTNLQLLAEIRHLLTKEGTFFTQVLNPQFWVKGEVVRDLGKTDGWPGRLMRRYRFDQRSSLLYDQLWSEDEKGKMFHRYPQQILRLYRPAELEAISLQAGFEKVQFCSAADWGPPNSPHDFHPSSPEYYVIAS